MRRRRSAAGRRPGPRARAAARRGRTTTLAAHAREDRPPVQGRRSVRRADGRRRVGPVTYARSGHCRPPGGTMSTSQGPVTTTPAGAGATPGSAVDHSRPPLADAEIDRATDLLRRVTDIFGQRVVGQEGLRTALVSTLVAGGHVLLESVPGLAKTTAAHTLASAVSGTFHRIQCTPDLMPNDIVGTQVFNYTTGEFSTQLGPGARQRRPPRRDQPLLRQDPVRDARGDAGEADLHRRARSTRCRRRSWCSPRRTPSRRRAPTSCPRRRWTASS